MGIKANINTDGVRQYFRLAAEELVKQICLQLDYLGQSCVKRIKEREDNWTDRTGNLRASIAAAVFSMARKKAQTALGNTSGIGGSEAQQYIDSIASRYSETYALVVVAGMDYAGYVEAMESKDVLNECRLWAEQEVDSYINDAIENTVAVMSKVRL